VLPSTWSVSGSEPSGSVSAGLTDGEFNLVGNPFAGYLDWNEVQDNASSVNATYQVWNPEQASYESYDAGSNSGEAPRYIPPMQGFWAEANSGASLNFEKEHLENPSSADPVVYKSTASTSSVLGLSLEGEDLTSNKAYLTFPDGAKTGSDPKDASWLPPFTNDNYATIRFVNPDEDSLTYDKRPQVGATQTETYELEVEATKGGTYTLTWPTFRNLPGSWRITLADDEQTVDLRQESEYEVDVESGNVETLTVEIENTTPPVEFSSVTGRVDEQDAILEWETASETNNAGFEVQHRSSDAESFEALGFVKSAVPSGTTDQPQQYRFRTDPLDPGRHVFRLRQVDLDGTESLSDTTAVAVRQDAPLDLQIAPNPVRSGSTIRVRLRKSQEASIHLYDVLGRRLQTLHDGRIEGGERRTFQLDAENLPSGAYFLRVNAEQVQETRRLTVVR